jgi:HEXXH motif-containing protein
MTTLLPPDTDALVQRIVARNSRRARQVHARLRRLANTAERRQACRALEATLVSLRGPRRRGLLWGPELRAWLHAAEEAMALARPQETEEALFERVAGGPHLGTLMPRGRMDSAFGKRARTLGERLLQRVFLRLPGLLLFLTPPGRRFGPFPLDLEADAEEARLAGELHVAFPSPYTWKLGRAARVELCGDEVRLLLRGGAPRCKPREVVPGTRILLARRAIAGRKGLRPGPAVRDLGPRLGEAMALVREAWQDAWRDIQIHTRVLVPVEERGVVSYSLPERPGTSYVNVEGKSRIDLADDLLHETAHHRLHSLEELSPLERKGVDAHYFSPWRRQVRPLHGILHATYTFTFRAQLFRRLQALPGRLPRAWLGREIRKEKDMLQQSLHCLRDAEDRGLLTAAGSGLLDDITQQVRRLGRA